MRILVALTPEKSFFNYLAPVAWALRTAGHEVRVASTPAMAASITQAGLTAVPVGRDRDPWRVAEANQDEIGDLRGGVAEPYDVFDDPDLAKWEYLKAGMADAVRGWHRLTNFPMIADLVGFARQWEPDLVLWEPLCYAGPIAAKACGAAHGRLLWGIDVFGVTREIFLRCKEKQPIEEQSDPLADWLASYGRKYGFEFSEDMTTGDFTVDQLPKSLRLESDLEYVPVQYVAYGGKAVVPKWLQEKPKRPRVGLTLGSTATEHFNGYNVPLAEIIDSLSTLDIELVATVTESQQHLLNDLPDNVRIVPYVPWHALAPTCSVVIHHAGAATLATTARHPVPQLSLHYHFDQPFLARRLAEHGAGLEIHTTKATGGNVRESVRRLLTEPQFQLRAKALADEIHAMPSPVELVPQLEALTTKHRTR
ncbi:activator-dependent family glycosyltransferase [Actinocrispum sp. NPDC049592]|uniref:activator-dependent family glycosyltransferase n=1 Tax=Actinocrispum sp. NPDC049592 TaxID=3154835 RepID=UPI0034300F7F